MNDGKLSSVDGTAAHIPSLDTQPLGCPTLASNKDGIVVG